MSNSALSNSLSDLLARIHQEHDAASNALKSAVSHAIAAGELLLQAKKQLNHGKWLPWLQSNCEIPERTAQAYMRLARLPIEKRNAVADLPLREALSAIRSREQRLADAEAREAKQADTYSGIVHTTKNGVSYYGAEAIERTTPTQQLPPPPPRTTDDIVRQIDHALHEVRDDVDVIQVRRAIQAELGDEEFCDDCDGPQEFWERSLANHAGDAAALRANWTRQFGDWQAFEVPTDVLALAREAAAEWAAIVEQLEARRGEVRR
jgi:hypothetical protein